MRIHVGELCNTCVDGTCSRWLQGNRVALRCHTNVLRYAPYVLWHVFSLHVLLTPYVKHNQHAFYWCTDNFLLLHSKKINDKYMVDTILMKIKQIKILLQRCRKQNKKTDLTEKWSVSGPGPVQYRPAPCVMRLIKLLWTMPYICYEYQGTWIQSSKKFAYANGK